MNNPKCTSCGSPMKRNGTTKAGAQRWRCKTCGASKSHRIDNAAKQLKAFLNWLMGKASLSEQACSKATFKRRANKFWKLWPMPEITGEVFDVLFVDGLYLSQNLVILIACTEDTVVSWHLAQSESSKSWAALMMKIPAPCMVVTDGGTGFKKAAKAIWPKTRIQRCLVHVKRQVIRKTTLNPQLDCGRELLVLAKRLPNIKDVNNARTWLVEYAEWVSKWETFLKEFTLKDGHKQYSHERLRSARHSLNNLIKEDALFTFIEMKEEYGGIWPSTNNYIEGRVNAQIRMMLLLHRGLSQLHRVKAVFWWCYLHSEFKTSEAEMLKRLPTDEDIEGLFASARTTLLREDGAPAEFDTGMPEWGEMHKSGFKETGWY